MPSQHPYAKRFSRAVSSTAEQRPPASPGPGLARADLLKPRVTVGLVTALPKEFAAVKAMLDDPVEYGVPGQGAGREYVLGEVPAKDGGTHAVALVLAGMGTNQGAARATLLLEHLPSIDAILMVGIAGGVPHPTKVESHVRLGDIVVSDLGGVMQYDLDKETLLPDGFVHVEHRHPPRPPSARLLAAVAELEAAEYARQHPWEPHIERAKDLSGAARPITADELHATDEPARIVPHPHDEFRRDQLPRVFKGVIASANKLLKNPQKRDMLRDRFGVKAIEMEGSGIADATWNYGVGYLVVRGICDYCDGQKGDTWQMYAAVVAAAYARALLGRVRAGSPAPSIPLAEPGQASSAASGPRVAPRGPDSEARQREEEKASAIAERAWSARGSMPFWLSIVTLGPSISEAAGIFSGLSIGVPTLVYIMYHLVGAAAFLDARSFAKHVRASTPDKRRLVARRLVLLDRATSYLAWGVAAMLIVTLVLRIEAAVWAPSACLRPPSRVHEAFGVTALRNAAPRDGRYACEVEGAAYQRCEIRNEESGVSLELHPLTEGKVISHFSGCLKPCEGASACWVIDLEHYYEDEGDVSSGKSGTIKLEGRGPELTGTWEQKPYKRQIKLRPGG